MKTGRQSASVLRVGIYNRCSTEEEAQKNALAIQAEESREIAVRKKWVIAAQYIESESGTSVKNRIEYQRLLEDMEKDLFDIVMIKSIDRLMRSAKDWYLFLSKLTENKKRLYIYLDDKFYTPDDSLISGIKAILAEEFSRELSKKIKNSHGRRQEMHRQKKAAGLNITRPMFGWDKIAKDVYQVNPQEAQAYRTAFDMARAGKGFYSIANYMYDQGVRGKNGNRISNVQWRKMIYSPRAHGTMVIHTREYDFGAKRFVNLPPEEWIYVENALPAIVTKEYQEEVLTAIADRKIACKFEGYTRNLSKVGMYDLSGKLICALCHAVYYRTTFQSGQRRLAEWKCSTALKNGRKSSNQAGCDNINLIEDGINRVIESACKAQYETLFGAQQNIIDETLAAVKKAISDNTAAKELERLKKEYGRLMRKKRVLFDKLMNETIKDDEFRQYNEELDSQMKPLSDTIDSLEEKSSLYSSYEERLTAIRESLSSGGIVDKAKTKELVRKIDKILVYPDSRIEIIFNKPKLLGLLKIYDNSIIEEKLDEKFFQISARYIHTNVFLEKRKEINQQILEIFKNNPDTMAKDLPGILGVGSSYVSASIKELKGSGRLCYHRNGNTHTGSWKVLE